MRPLRRRVAPLPPLPHSPLATKLPPITYPWSLLLPPLCVPEAVLVVRGECELMRQKLDIVGYHVWNREQILLGRTGFKVKN